MDLKEKILRSNSSCTFQFLSIIVENQIIIILMGVREISGQLIEPALSLLPTIDSIYCPSFLLFYSGFFPPPFSHHICLWAERKSISPRTLWRMRRFLSSPQSWHDMVWHVPAICLSSRYCINYFHRSCCCIIQSMREHFAVWGSLRGTIWGAALMCYKRGCQAGTLTISRKNPCLQTVSFLYIPSSLFDKSHQ